MTTTLVILVVCLIITAGLQFERLRDLTRQMKASARFNDTTTSEIGVLFIEVKTLRERIESLERAHGLIPGTSMHANWKEQE